MELEVTLDFEAQFKYFTFEDMSDSRKKCKLEEIANQCFVIIYPLKRKPKSPTIKIKIEGFQFHLQKAHTEIQKFAR